VGIDATAYHERLLWFEGTGLVNSNWRIELLIETNTFKRETLIDFVFTFRYTGREGGADFGEKRKQNLRLPQKGRLFSAAHDFADAWYAFLHQAGDDTQTLKLDLNPDQFPVPPRGKQIEIQHVLVLLRLSDGAMFNSGDVSLKVMSGPNSHELPLKKDGLFGDMPHEMFNVKGPISGEWNIEVSGIRPNTLGVDGKMQRLERAKIADLGFVFLF
jgi:hypothetical protein